MITKYSKYLKELVKSDGDLSLLAEDPKVLTHLNNLTPKSREKTLHILHSLFYAHDIHNNNPAAASYNIHFLKNQKNRRIRLGDDETGEFFNLNYILSQFTNIINPKYQFFLFPQVGDGYTREYEIPDYFKLSEKIIRLKIQKKTELLEANFKNTKSIKQEYDKYIPIKKANFIKALYYKDFIQEISFVSNYLVAFNKKTCSYILDSRGIEKLQGKGRTFTTANILSKKLRKVLFKGCYEADINAALPTIVTALSFMMYSPKDNKFGFIKGINKDNIKEKIKQKYPLHYQHIYNKRTFREKLAAALCIGASSGRAPKIARKSDIKYAKRAVTILDNKGSIRTFINYLKKNNIKFNKSRIYTALSEYADESKKIAKYLMQEISGSKIHEFIKNDIRKSNKRVSVPRVISRLYQLQESRARQVAFIMESSLFQIHDAIIFSDLNDIKYIKWFEQNFNIPITFDVELL